MGAVREFLSADQVFKNNFLKVIQSVRIYDLNINNNDNNNNEKISIESVILIFIRSRRIINKTIIMKKKTILRCKEILKKKEITKEKR